MIQQPLYLTEVFKTWGAAVNAALPFTVYYQSAHLTEVLENLQQLDRAGKSELKYPLIILLCDIPEEIGGRDSAQGQYQYATLNMIICATTVNTFKQGERLAKNFKPVLYPIYYQLMEAIYRSKFTSVYNTGELRHMKYDRYFWGRESIWGNKANITNDYIDAIEIKNLRVKFKLDFCQKLITQ